MFGSDMLAKNNLCCIRNFLVAQRAYDRWWGLWLPRGLSRGFSKIGVEALLEDFGHALSLSVSLSLYLSDVKIGSRKIREINGKTDKNISYGAQNGCR